MQSQPTTGWQPGRGPPCFTVRPNEYKETSRTRTTATAEAFCRVAFILSHSGQAQASAQALSRSEALLDEMGAGGSYWVRRENRGTVSKIRETLDSDAFAEALEQGRAFTLDEAIASALDSLAQPD